MKKVSFIIIILTISIIGNVLFLYASFIYKKYSLDNNTILEKMVDKEKREFSVESMTINPYESVQTITGDSIFLNSINHNTYKRFILVISGNECGSCIENTLGLINTQLQNSDKRNIIVLGFFHNKRELFLLSKKYPFQFFLVDENSSLLNALRNSPVFLITDSDYKIHSVFYPIQKVPELTIGYLKLIPKALNL